MFLKEYKSLKGYLERYTVFKLGNLHIRLHKIKSADKTPFQHSHPFHYISIILRGGYTEQINDEIKVHKVGSLIFRKNKTLHRINSVLPETITLFITWKTQKYKWGFSKKEFPVNNWIKYEKGIYQREVFGKSLFCKFDRFWHIGNIDLEKSINEFNPSINQTQSGQLIKLLD